MELNVRAMPSTKSYLLTRLQLLPLLALDPAVLVLDPGLRQDDPRELRPRPNVEVRQLDLGSHFDGESNQIVEEIDSNQVSNLILCEVDRTSMDERLYSL